MPDKTVLYLVLFFSSIFVLPAQNYDAKNLNLKTTNYVMHTTVDYENEKLISSCELTLTNPSKETISTIPLLLYRLLKVNSVTDENGNRLPFTQHVVSFDDWKVYQVNFIEIKLDKPIEKDSYKKITVNYSGHLLGYTETGMSYVKDHISPEFTIIRPDCNAYPKLGYPSFEMNGTALENFNYTVHVTVPDSLVVANGGNLIEKTLKDGLATYSYENIKPAWRIDLAIANYEIIQDGDIKIFHFPQDATNAQQVLKASHQTIDLYSQWFGRLNNASEFSIIEIPDNWGSQADVTSIIQAAAAFKNSDHHYELYHEISHLWNVKSNDDYSPRWNEGLAMFLQYLTANLLEDKTILHEKTNSYITRINSADKYKNVALIDYGKEGVAGYSYTTGMVLFHVLYELIGQDSFNTIIQKYYTTYQDRGATTKEFIKTIENLSSIDLSSFIEDWFLSTNYTKVMAKHSTIDKLSSYYKK